MYMCLGLGSVYQIIDALDLRSLKQNNSSWDKTMRCAAINIKMHQKGLKENGKIEKQPFLFVPTKLYNAQFRKKTKSQWTWLRLILTIDSLLLQPKKFNSETNGYKINTWGKKCVFSNLQKKCHNALHLSLIIFNLHA